MDKTAGHPITHPHERRARRASNLRRVMRISTTDGLFATQYANLTTGTFLATFLLALGASEFLIGLIAALPLLGGLVQPVGAEIIRRRGGYRKSILIAAALVDDLLWLVSLSAVVVLDTKTALAILACVLAIQQAAGAVVAVSWTSWISDLIPPGVRGRYFGRRNFICHGFGAVTAAAAGLLVRTFGQDIVVFVALIATGVVLRLASIYFLSRQPETQPARSPAGPVLAQFSKPLRIAGFRRFLAYGMAWGFAVQLSAPFFTVYMIRDAGVGVDAVLLFAALGTISNLLGQRLWGPLADRYGEHQVMRVAGLSIALQPLWWIFTGPSGFGFYLMALLSMTGGFMWGGHLLATGNLMMRLAPDMGRTSFFAVQAALGGLFGAAGPLIGGLIAQALASGWTVLPGTLFAGLKMLFVISFLLRLVAWGLLHRVPQGVDRPRLRAVYLLRDAARTFNPAQGFSPLLHVFTLGREAARRTSGRHGTISGSGDGAAESDRPR